MFQQSQQVEQPTAVSLQMLRLDKVGALPVPKRLDYQHAKQTLRRVLQVLHLQRNRLRIVQARLTQLIHTRGQSLLILGFQQVRAAIRWIRVQLNWEWEEKVLQVCDKLAER